MTHTTLTREADAIRLRIQQQQADVDELTNLIRSPPKQDKDILKPYRTLIKRYRDDDDENALEKLEAKLKALEAKQNALKAEQNALEAKQKALKAEQNALKAEQNALEAKQNALEAEQKALKAEQKALKAERDGKDSLSAQYNGLHDSYNAMASAYLTGDLDSVKKANVQILVISAAIAGNNMSATNDNPSVVPTTNVVSPMFCIDAAAQDAKYGPLGLYGRLSQLNMINSDETFKDPKIPSPILPIVQSTGMGKTFSMTFLTRFRDETLHGDVALDLRRDAPLCYRFCYITLGRFQFQNTNYQYVKSDPCIHDVVRAKMENLLNQSSDTLHVYHSFAELILSILACCQNTDVRIDSVCTEFNWITLQEQSLENIGNEIRDHSKLKWLNDFKKGRLFLLFDEMGAFCRDNEGRLYRIFRRVCMYFLRNYPIVMAVGGTSTSLRNFQLELHAGGIAYRPLPNSAPFERRTCTTTAKVEPFCDTFWPYTKIGDLYAARPLWASSLYQESNTPKNTVIDEKVRTAAESVGLFTNADDNPQSAFLLMHLLGLPLGPNAEGYTTSGFFMLTQLPAPGDSLVLQQNIPDAILADSIRRVMHSTVVSSLEELRSYFSFFLSFAGGRGDVAECCLFFILLQISWENQNEFNVQTLIDSFKICGDYQTLQFGLRSKNRSGTTEFQSKTHESLSISSYRVNIKQAYYARRSELRHLNQLHLELFFRLGFVVFTSKCFKGCDAFVVGMSDDGNFALLTFQVKALCDSISPSADLLDKSSALNLDELPNDVVVVPVLVQFGAGSINDFSELTCNKAIANHKSAHWLLVALCDSSSASSLSQKVAALLTSYIRNDVAGSLPIVGPNSFSPAILGECLASLRTIERSHKRMQPLIPSAQSGHASKRSH
jgi:hypothetical protein